MRDRWARLVCAGAVTLLCVGCNPGSVAFREGRKAELHADYDTAVIDYGKALQYRPENSQYLIHEKLARQKASQFHLRQGQRLLAERRTDAAIGEFQKAASIDPTNEAASEQLRSLLAQQATAEAARQKALQEALKPPPAGQPAGVRLKPFPPEPEAHIRISGESRRVFETIAQLAGLNVVFTHDFQAQSHTISLNLTNVKLEDVLQLAAIEANAFWKPVTPNTILVIPDNPTNRRIYQDQVLETFHLSNPLSATDQTQLSSALKQVLGLRSVINNAGSNSIIVRDTPENVVAAGQLIRSLDLDHGEILIDVTVLEANRDRIRDLGISPAPITGNTQVAVGFTPPGSTPTTGGGTTVSPLPLNKLGKLSTADFSIVLPGAIANAVLSDAQTHILESPELRVTDGQKATLRIGSRVPYATGSFLPSFGGVAGGTAGTGLGLLASTQFQYQDVGVNLDITPHINSNGEVSMHAKIEISSVGAPVTIGGLNEPSFNQRIVEHDIQLKEGEVSVLGGLIQSQESRTVSGLPGLGDIPVLRYLFSTENKEITKNEVLIMLTPHVIRLPEVAPAMSSTVQPGAGFSTEPGALQEPVPPEGTQQ